MSGKVKMQTCKFCGALITKYDERTGDVIYFGKVLKKGAHGETVGVCPKCKHEAPLDSWNPLYLEK